jgi:hypothetical protein
LRPGGGTPRGAEPAAKRGASLTEEGPSVHGVWLGASGERGTLTCGAFVRVWLLPTSTTTAPAPPATPTSDMTITVGQSFHGGSHFNRGTASLASFTEDSA